jgi:hypothetical protein
MNWQPMSTFSAVVKNWKIAGNVQNAKNDTGMSLCELMRALAKRLESVLMVLSERKSTWAHMQLGVAIEDDSLIKIHRKRSSGAMVMILGSGKKSK